MRFEVEELGSKLYFLITFSEKQTEVIWVGPMGLIPTQDEKSPNTFSTAQRLYRKCITQSLAF